ncbi:hypothetical protein D9M68_701840 [compost metagenome]
MPCIKLLLMTGVLLLFDTLGSALPNKILFRICGAAPAALYNAPPPLLVTSVLLLIVTLVNTGAALLLYIPPPCVLALLRSISALLNASGASSAYKPPPVAALLAVIRTCISTGALPLLCTPPPWLRETLLAFMVTELLPFAFPPLIVKPSNREIPASPAETTT